MSTPKIRTLLVASFVLLHLAPGCERSSPRGEPEVESADVEAELVQDSVPEVIDSDWVASKLELPPPRDVGGDSQPRPRHKRSYDPGKPLRGWPPAVGQFYPDVVLEDQTGQITGISDFRGKVVLVEVVGLTCPACNALSGGNDPGKGRFRGIQPQPGLSSIDRYAQMYARTSLDHPDVVFVQLVLYGMDGRSPPTRADLRAWASHFGLSRNRNEVVLIGDQRFISPASRRLIPGFHLIDQQGILRSITSNDPRHDDLYTVLLPKLASLLEEGR